MGWMAKECRYYKNHRKKSERKNEKRSWSRRRRRRRRYGRMVMSYIYMLCVVHLPMGTKINIKDKHWAHSHWKWFCHWNRFGGIHSSTSNYDAHHWHIYSLCVYGCINVSYVTHRTVGNGPFLNMHRKRRRRRSRTFVYILTSTYIYQVIKTRTNDKHFQHCKCLYSILA